MEFLILESHQDENLPKITNTAALSKNTSAIKWWSRPTVKSAAIEVKSLKFCFLSVSKYHMGESMSNLCRDGEILS